MNPSWRRRCGALAALLSVVNTVVPGVGAQGFGLGGVGPQSIPSSTTTTSASTTTSVTPTVIFFNLGQVTTCTTQQLGWLFVGASQQMNVRVTNSGVDQTFSTSSSSSVVGSVPKKRAVIDEPVCSTPANLETCNWTVDIPEGDYILTGLLASGGTPQSQTFFVKNGSDTSCLGQTSTSSSSTGATSTSTTSHSSATKTSTSATSTGSSVLSSSGGTSKSSHTGAIAGGVVGGILAILAVLAAVYYIFSIAPAKKRAQGHGGGEKRNWGNLPLGSVDYTARNAGQAQTAPAAPTGPTPGSSDDDIGAFGGEVKSAPAHYNAAVMPLAYDSRSSFTPSMIAPSPFRTKIPSAGVPSSHNSFDSSHGVASFDPNRMSRSRSDGPAVGVQSMPERPSARRSSLDLNHVGTESIPMARTNSAHRPARKPVPKYDSSAEQNPFETQPSTPSTTAGSHGQTSPIANAAHSNGSTDQNLLHKSSFPEMGNRPMHYLIPDMPPPQQWS